MPSQSTNYELRGFNHVAMVCRDMQDTVDFYEGILGFPLIKTLDLGGHGQHFFFQVTENDGVAFFWFDNANAAQPGVASADWSAGEMNPSRAQGLASKAAPGAMHHLSFGVPADKLDEYREIAGVARDRSDRGDQALRREWRGNPVDLFPRPGRDHPRVQRLVRDAGDAGHVELPAGSGP